MRALALAAAVLMWSAASSLVAQVHVRGYTRADGTYVAPHYRSSPNSTTEDNYSTRGNVNPFTGERGTRPPEPNPRPPSVVVLPPSPPTPTSVPTPRSTFRSSLSISTPRFNNHGEANGGPIPAQFHGEWNEDTAACGTGNNDSRLQIGAEHIRFYESGGSVRGAFTRGPYEMVVVLDMSGEGQTWMAAEHFVLASDGRYLSSPQNGSLVRYRCP